MEHHAASVHSLATLMALGVLAACETLDRASRMLEPGWPNEIEKLTHRAASPRAREAPAFGG